MKESSFKKDGSTKTKAKKYETLYKELNKEAERLRHQLDD